mgnify:CR=1 FL=1
MLHIPTDYDGHEHQDPETLDSLAIAFVDAKHFAGESALFESKWWDYRMMHPTKATLLFAHSYKRAIKRALRIRSDIYRAANYKGLKDPSLFMNAKATYTGMWKARQEADRHGIPYEFWCWQAMVYAEERNWSYLPKPQQLYSTKPHKKARAGDPSIVEHIQMAWATKWLDSLVTAVDPFYCLDHYRKHPYQIAYQRELWGRVNNANLRPETIGYLVYEIRHLSEKLVLAARSDADYLLRSGQKYASILDEDDVFQNQTK